MNFKNKVCFLLKNSSAIRLGLLDLYTLSGCRDAIRLLAIKNIRQNYAPSDRILNLLEQFRLMVNDCIRIGIANKHLFIKNAFAEGIPQT